MLRKISTLFLASVVTFSLSGCQGDMNKQSSGRLIGGVTGGLLSSQFGKGSGQLIAIGAGVLAGTMIGDGVGKSLDEYDRQVMYKTSQRALEVAPTGNRVKWENPDSGNYGYITPTKTIETNNMVCREYQQEIIVGGKKQQGYGRACRQVDGSWKIVQ